MRLYPHEPIEIKSLSALRSPCARTMGLLAESVDRVTFATLVDVHKTVQKRYAWDLRIQYLCESVRRTGFENANNVTLLI